MIGTAMEYEDHRTIATPEGVQLALPLAGIGSRFMALSLDYLICGVAYLVAILAALALGDDLAAAIVVGDRGPGVLCRLSRLFEVLGGGRTLGKRASGLRVVMDGGAQVGLRASLIRNIIRLIEVRAVLHAGDRSACSRPATTSGWGTSPRGRWWCATPSSSPRTATPAAASAAGALRELGRHRHRR